MDFKHDTGPIPSLIRWIHVLAGVMWVGHLYFFNFVNSSFAPTMDAETKRKVIPELMPRALFWFRWGALFTWATGLILLVLLFYHGRIALAANDPVWDGKDPRWGGLQLAMLGVTFLGTFLYDVVVKSVLKTNVALFWGGFLLVCAVLWGYAAAGFGNRSTSIHLGALFGTIMAFNVWFRIWPAQRQIITAIKAGEKPEDALVAMAGGRSRHNTFMSVPLIFLMLNVHNTWSSTDWNAGFPVMLAVMVLVGWAVTNHLYGISKKVKGF